MITELEPIWVGAMPTQLEMGKLYISKSFDVAIHLCVCGCGMHTVTPLGGDGWTLGTHTDGSVSLYPSIRNPCGAHYWIDHDRVKLAHIAAVQARLQTIIHELNIRAAHHDESKLWEPEKSGYDRLTLALTDVAYDTEAYRAALAEAQSAIAHHYQVNRHHPEHFPDGITNMTLIDLIEMLCDWKAASERTQQDSIAKSLTHNQQRFGIDDQLATILANTVQALEW